MYLDLRVMYPQLITASQKAECEDTPVEEGWVRLAQTEWEDEIMTL